MSAKYTAAVAAIFGLFLVVSNLLTLIKPSSGLEQLGFGTQSGPLQGHDTNQKLAQGLMRMFAASRLVIGLTQISAWWFTEHRVLGCQLIFSSVMGAVDGLVTKDILGTGQWSHWGSIPAGLVVGILVLAPA